MKAKTIGLILVGAVVLFYVYQKYGKPAPSKKPPKQDLKPAPLVTVVVEEKSSGTDKQFEDKFQFSGRN